MKQHIKLFEEFLNEEDPLADLDLGLGGNDKEKKDKEKEDPFKKEKDAAKKKAEKEKKKHEEFIEKKKEKIEDILKDYPEIEKKTGDKIIDAVNSQDRVKIHNMFNDLMALQISYQEKGDMATVNHLAKLKDQIDDLDMSYTDDKQM